MVMGRIMDTIVLNVGVFHFSISANLVPMHFTHHCLPILYTNFLVEYVFYYLCHECFCS